MSPLKYTVFTISVFSFTGLYAQKSMTGKVLNERTKEPIAFATISFAKTKTSIPSDAKGFFELKDIKKNENDTLLFTGVGYLSLKVPVRDLVLPFEVYLEEDVKTLNEVNISQNRKELQVGNFNIGSTVFFGNWGAEYAKRFEMPSTHQYLKEILIARDLIYFPQSPETKFRINIYDENPVTKGPGKKICLDIIEVHDLNNNRITIDVSKYNISILNSPFFVSVETLPIPYNERYNIYRQGKVDDIVREQPAYYEVYYQPHLRIGRSKENEAWTLSIQPGSAWRKETYAPAIKIVVN